MHSTHENRLITALFMETPELGCNSDLTETREVLEYVLHLAEEVERNRGGAVRFEDTALRTVAELVRAYVTQTLVPDLVAFARHAKRQRLLAADVLLCARRNTDLRVALEQKLQRPDFESEADTTADMPLNEPQPDVALF